MKKTAFSLLLLAGFLSCTPSHLLVMADPSERSYRMVRSVNLTKKEIFDKAVEWVSKSPSLNMIPTVKNPESGVVVANGSTSLVASETMGVTVPGYFTVQITAKDKKYQVIFSDYWLYNGGARTPIEQKYYTDQMNRRAANLAESLHKYLSESNDF